MEELALCSSEERIQDRVTIGALRCSCPGSGGFQPRSSLYLFRRGDIQRNVNGLQGAYVLLRPHRRRLEGEGSDLVLGALIYLPRSVFLDLLSTAVFAGAFPYPQKALVLALLETMVR